MKVARLWLLVVLAVLLPLRVALAQALPCTGGPSEQTVHAAQGHAQGHSQGHSHGTAPGHVAEYGQSHGHDDHLAAAAGLDAGHDHASAAGDHGKCSACATCCTGAPAASPVAVLAPVLASATLKFSSWSAPVPSVVLDGPDRPPRRA